MEKIKILHRNYGISKELQETIDKTINMISNEYEKLHPTLGINKDRLYSTLSNVEYYEKNPEKIIDSAGNDNEVFEGGMFDPASGKMKINKLCGNGILDEHTFIHELTHSFLSIRTTFGSFLDEGLVDIQASDVAEKYGIPKSRAYPEERMLVKILSTILGEENLLEYGTKSNTNISFDKYDDIIHMLRVKGTIATAISDETPLKIELMHSMIDDLNRLFERKYGKSKEKDGKIKETKQILEVFSKSENPDLISQNNELLQSFFSGLELEKLGEKVINIRKMNRAKSDNNFKALSCLHFEPDTILWCSKLDSDIDEKRELYMMGEDYCSTTYGWLENTEGRQILAYDKDSNEISIVNESIKKKVVNFIKNLKNKFTESIDDNALFSKTKLSDIKRVQALIIGTTKENIFEEENKKDDRDK